MQHRNFQTPFQLLHQWLPYGCRAYPLTYKALQNKQKKDLKTDPHTEIGYLVGYDSTNIFRIWIPSSSEVRRLRDVTFNEHKFYEGKVEPQEPIPQRLEVQLPAHIEDESEYEEIPTRMEEPNPQPDTPSSTTSGQEDASTIQVQQEPSEHEDSEDELHDADNPYPTPDPAQSDQQLRRSSRPPKPRNFGSFASSQNHFHSSFFLGREEKLHRRSLPPEPTSYKELSTHRFGPQFKEAAHAEWKSLQQRGTFKAVPRDQATGRPLPLTWVFKYKFDKHGFLIKFKARLCVRGDLQKLGDKDTYAATLAGRSFRVLMAITAKFDLETRQLDAVNAFTNALLDDEEEVYVLFPDGYYRQGWVLRLIRALYGLRRSPLLWQKELTAAFKELGLLQCPDEPCIFQNDWLTVFFFVDDIVFLHRKGSQDAADQMVAALKRKYAMTDQGELQWFLDSYIERMVQRFGLRCLDTFKGAPFPCNEVRPNTGQASQDQIQLYQSKVGSLNYAACITRPDIAKPASKLAEFLHNPSELHSKLADHLIEYLYATRYLAIQFSAQHHSDFQSASDAAFADDKETRKSSQGSILTLFGGPIAWKAGKQDTTIRLVTQDIPRLRTALRHIDIHTCWARQAFEEGLYSLVYTPTSEMIADGLTKVLPGQKFTNFVKQLGLVDISTLLGM
ncbi:reverse transcriptase (RNA-dependent DNA polymerase) [Hirsutella rhossiliensis]|uniref:Reverse transcriptase (RNA-dependent DNA polymerase) domain-containing protein n=1 Tax=Hirsutella rhossiliensis TaxID=111463 RepID=A0A9P8SI02_9HYPO|nr:reverse transcriptase (RNA-dependent DNA polymerase) domain-containing protein [Hirsutella rhossiliensis]KAH0962105.1 reverse transcriptase (RNA-dependent DNA polymerase) domain-containing protein [Hirsutella rhossiliensis]